MRPAGKPGATGKFLAARTRIGALLLNGLLHIVINAMIFRHEANCALSAAARHCSYGCGHGASVGFGGGMHKRAGASWGARLCDQLGGMAHVPGQSGPFGRRLFLNQRV
jgi:hypothetical protein